MMSATVLGLATFAISSNVHADTAKAGDTIASGTTTDTNANLTVEAGTLSFTKPDDVNFKNAKVQEVYAKGYTDSKSNSTTITDFLGDKGTWSLTASASGFNDAALSTDQASTLSVNGIALTTDAQSVKTGSIADSKTPTFDTPLTYDLTIKETTMLHAGNFTNTITWNLANTPGSNADSTTDATTPKGN